METDFRVQGFGRSLPIRPLAPVTNKVNGARCDLGFVGWMGWGSPSARGAHLRHFRAEGGHPAGMKPPQYLRSNATAKARGKDNDKGKGKGQ